MKENELISIIIPAYNAEKTLKKCVLSVIKQTYKNIEIIIINDGSTDKTLQICNDLKKTDNRIVIINKKNGGLSDARNRGIDNANGKYYVFVDSDDCINHKYIEILFNLQKKYKADVVTCEFLKFYSFDEINCLEEIIDNYDVEISYNEDCLKEYLDRKGGIKIYHSVWNKLYKKELFSGISFEVGRYHEDLFITYKLMKKCTCLVATNATLYYYYKNNKSSICSTYGDKNFIDQCDSMYQIYSELKNDKDIKEELSYYIINNSLDIYYLGYSLHNQKLNEKINDLKMLIYRCSNNIKCIDRIKVFIKLLFPRIFIKKRFIS